MSIVTLLAENTSSMGMGLTSEHGLSFLIETEKRSILFDTGQGMVLGPNARILGKDLDKVDTIVLSHGHYDHTGGLKFFLDKKRDKEIRLIAHPKAFEAKWAGLDTDNLVSIGSPFSIEELEKNNFELVYTEEAMDITPGIKTTGEVPMLTEWEEIESYFFAGKPAEKDKMADDMGLILNSDKGNVLILGCTHRGIINTLNHVEKLSDQKHFHCIMGGLHLSEADENKLEKVAEELKKFSFDQMIIGHCTGINAYSYLRSVFGAKIKPLSVGLSWQVKLV